MLEKKKESKSLLSDTCGSFWLPDTRGSDPVWSSPTVQQRSRTPQCNVHLSAQVSGGGDYSATWGEQIKKDDTTEIWSGNLPSSRGPRTPLPLLYKAEEKWSMSHTQWALRVAHALTKCLTAACWICNLIWTLPFSERPSPLCLQTALNHDEQDADTNLLSWFLMHCTVVVKKLRRSNKPRSLDVVSGLWSFLNTQPKELRPTKKKMCSSFGLTC